MMGKIISHFKVSNWFIIEKRFLKKLSVCLSIFLAFCFFFLGFRKQEKAELVLTNGKVFTVSENNPWVEAVAVRDGRIIALGSDEEIQ